MAGREGNDHEKVRRFQGACGGSYKGVADVRLAGQKLEILERETGQVIKLDFDSLLPRRR
jgi:hypothetical protein